MKRILSFLLIITILFGASTSISITSNALESTGNSKMDAFINDSRWTNGISWRYDKLPIIASFQAWGCCAYCADYVKYCYGYNNPRSGTAFYNTNDIQAGDVLTVGNQTDGSGHWFVCLKRSGNRLYVAEGNYSNKVRIGWNYTISGNKFAEDARGFTAGYHYYPVTDTNPPTNATISVSKTIVDINEEVTFSFSANTSAKFAIGINKDGNRIITEYVNSGKSYSFSQEGNYTAYVTAYNDAGDIDSNVVAFSVRDIQNLGDSFTAYIIHNKSGSAVISNNDNVMVSNFDKDNIEQKWLFSRQSDCSYKISSVAYSSKCLDVAGAESANRTNIQICSSNNTNAQRWFICHNQSGYSLIPKCAPLKAFDLDANVVGDKSNIHLWDYKTGGTPQIFSFRIAPTTYYSEQHNGNEYRLYNTDLSWKEAYKFCEQSGGHLVTVESKAEQEFITDFAKKYSTKDRIWLGANDILTEGKWAWVTGESFNYTNWNVGEPNNAVDEDYLMMEKTNGKWNDTRLAREHTANKFSFICEFENSVEPSKYTPIKTFESENHLYEVYTNDIDWQTAKSVCAAKGGHLVTIESSSENNALKNALSAISKTKFWMGLTDVNLENQWAWINGEKLSYVNWGTGEPNNDSCIEDYASFSLPNGKWNDLPGYALTGFICEYDPIAIQYTVPALNGISSEITFKNAEKTYLITNENGIFHIENTKNGIYTVYAKQKNSLRVCLGNYQTQAGEYINNNTITLPLGDVNGDDVIDVADISLLLSGENYAMAQETLDLNGDNLITVADIATILQAENYGKTSDLIV